MERLKRERGFKQELVSVISERLYLEHGLLCWEIPTANTFSHAYICAERHNTSTSQNFVLENFCEVCFGQNFPYRFPLRIAGVLLLMQGHIDSVVSGPDGCFQSRRSLYFSTAVFLCLSLYSDWLVRRGNDVSAHIMREVSNTSMSAVRPTYTKKTADILWAELD